ncbi:MAG: hypothetical protein MJ123_03350 [Lachnospiraceae bacterium]|nr:hypothetical protein [Lachnospiraceae bacterium]
MAKVFRHLEMRVRRKLRGLINAKYKLGENDDEVDRAVFKWLYKGKQLLENDELNAQMLHKLCNNEPFMFARLGMTEANIVGEYIEKELGGRTEYSENWISWLYRTSGFFGDKNNVDADVDKYAKLTLEAVKDTDYFACWQPLYVDYIANHYVKNGKLFKYNKVTGHSVNSIEDNHWSKGLAGKKVLVVSSFPESITKQYAIKEKLCNVKERCLPDFELITYKSPETQMGENTEDYKDWFDAFEKLEREVLAIDFDVALIGCGAYGYPLAASVRRSGKTAIELCGSLVKLFGIYGKGLEGRWGKELESWKTEYWIRPIDTPPACYKQIERGSYW